MLGGYNTYGYGLGNPLTHSDPFGLDPNFLRNRILGDLWSPLTTAVDPRSLQKLNAQLEANRRAFQRYLPTRDQAANMAARTSKLASYSALLCLAAGPEGIPAAAFLGAIGYAAAGAEQAFRPDLNSAVQSTLVGITTRGLIGEEVLSPVGAIAVRSIVEEALDDARDESAQACEAGC